MCDCELVEGGGGGGGGGEGEGGMFMLSFHIEEEGGEWRGNE